MFLGEYSHTIDEKGRLTIPAKFRAALAGGIVITQGLDGCLAIYPLPEWEKLAGKINSLPVTTKAARNFRRFLFSEAAQVQPDRLGRILVPKSLRERADVNGETLIVGLDTYLEAWNPGRWKEVRSQAEEERESLAEQLGI